MTRLIPKPTGSRRALAQQTIIKVFDHWHEIEPNTEKTRGELTLTHLFRNEPANYARLVASLLPKDITLTSVAEEMDDAQLDDVIGRIQEKLIEARAQAARPIPGPGPIAIGSGVSELAGGEEQAVTVESRPGRNDHAASDHG